MKKSIILTSLLALSACGGGSGGGGVAVPSSPSNGTMPVVTIQGFSGGTTVNENNSGLTNMASYTNTYGTDEATSKQEMVDYVSSKLAAAGFTRNNSSRAGVRAASRASVAPRGNRDDAEFANADAVLTRMKQVIHDMVLKKAQGADKLTEYVTQYKHYVAEALVIADQMGAEAQNATVEELITAFNNFVTTADLTPDNLIERMDEFDVANFHITKERMERIKLIDTGQDAYFKFKLDDTGKIESVSLWENPIGEYGTAWTDTSLNHQVRIIIDEGTGNAYADYGHGLNPFEDLDGIGDDGYLNSDAGYLARNGNGTAFTNTMYRYVFNVGEDDFEDAEIISNTQLTLADAKERLKQYVIERVNKNLHSQPSDEQSYLDGLVDTANTVLDTIDGLTDDDMPAYQTFTQTATMHGVGKDVQLKYSDFGYSKMVREMEGQNPEQQYLTYVGGYDTRRMDNDPAHNNLTSGTTFTGTAIVTVEDAHADKDHPDDDYLNTALFRDTAATLEYTTSGGVATHTLTMNNLKATEGATANSDWYKTVVSGTENNPTLTYNFDSTGKTIDSGYQFFAVEGGELKRNESTTNSPTAPIVATDNSAVEINMASGTNIDSNHKLHGSANASYYGEDPANPTEATSGFYVSEHYHSTDNKLKHELAVYGAFGGLKDAE